MGDYKIQIKLITEAIFGSGYSIPGSVDLEVVCDDFGLPYMKAKTFKGNFREAMEDIVSELGKKKYGSIIDNLLGTGGSGVEQWKTLKFSDMTLAQGIRSIIEKAVQEQILSSGEIKESLTEVRSFTSVDKDGSSIKGSLRQIRVIRKDLIFEVELEIERELTRNELGLLSMTTKHLRHLGTMKSRGKGEVKCTLLEKENGKYTDNTNKYIDEFIEVVKSNA
ncbi:RAMP superfamily CRISPR-associated protein [Paratissierella segnis]|jgi:CRISPR-associated protein Csx10|nr:RAMP superfamily CRISPR-associated protein [Paratissierella segnis]